MVAGASASVQAELSPDAFSEALAPSACPPPSVSLSADNGPALVVPDAGSSPVHSTVSSEEASPAVVSCPICAKSATTLSTPWQHINVSHISRGVFPSLGMFKHHHRFICSGPSCRFGYLKRWSVCQRSLGSNHRCGALLVDPSLVSVIAHDESLSPESPVLSSSSLPCLLSSVRSPPERMIIVAVQAAIDGHLPAELASIESLIFDTFLGRLCSLRIYSVHHVPCLARPLFTKYWAIQGK